MKKYLLATTALVAATLLAGTANAAEPLKVTVGGEMQQWFGVLNQKETKSLTSATNRVYDSVGINTDTEVDFKGKTTLDNGMVVEMAIDLYTNHNNVSAYTHDEYVKLGTKFGQVIAGQRESTNHAMHHEAPDVGMGYSDVDIWIRHPLGWATFGGPNATNAVAGPDQGNFVKTSMKTLIDESSPSVGYVSPQFYGFSVAGTFSSAPGGQRGASGAALGAVNQNTTVNNAWDATIAYDNTLGGVTIGADAGMGRRNNAKTNVSAASTATTPATDLNNVEAYNGGLKLGYAGFSVGGAYLRWMEPDKYVAFVPSLEGSAWNVGASYANGPWAVSALYFRETHLGLQATAGTERFDTYMASGKYALGPGIDFKASAFYARYKSSENSDDNHNTKGYGLVSGLDLTF